MKESKEPIYSVGLDIGNSKVCAVAGKKDLNGKITILDYAEAQYNSDYESMLKGSAKNKENVTLTVERVLQELSIKTNLEIVLTNTNFSNEQISVKSIKQDVTKDGSKFVVKNYELEELINNTKKQLKKDSNKENLHLMPTDFFIDEMKVGKYPKGATGNKLTCVFNAINAPKNRYEEHLQTFERLNYEMVEGSKNSFDVMIDRLVYSGMADALSCISIEDRQAGILLVNIGAHLTEVSIFKDYGLRYTNVLPIGSEAIIKDIAQAFNVTDLQAERLMRASGEKPSNEIEINEVLEIEGKNGLPTRQFLQKAVAMVIESRLKEIAALIASDVIDSGYARLLANGLMLTGGIARLGLTKLTFTKTFSPLAIRIADSTVNIDINTKLELAQPKYSTAIGVMLASMKPLDERLPLNKVVREKRKMSLGFFSNLPLVNTIREILDEPDLRRAYGE
ncbi:cell division protein FtsA [Jiulongibacter sp. NS-SX5]|uniref:cell division protein FtsA n=1 Tax=Jiulongibacter sp. NS-SX5 TaxID=3463854 RepID=UPI0040592AB5